MIEEHNVPDDELLLMPGLCNLHEADGYMGSVAYGLGLHKCPGINCALSYFKVCIRSRAYTSNGQISNDEPDTPAGYDTIDALPLMVAQFSSDKEDDKAEEEDVDSSL